MTARRQEGKALLDLSLEISATAAQECSEAAIESKFLSMMTDKIEDQTLRLTVGLSEATAELLEKQGRTIGWAQEQQRIDDWNVNAFIEEIHGEQRVDAPGGDVVKRALPLDRWRVRPNGKRGYAGFVEHSRHESCVLDAHAEAQRPHPARRCPHAGLVP